jgi:methionyl-tRNA formyltransferase
MANSKINLKLKIIFVGTPEFGAIILDKLIQNNLKPVLVITAPDKPVGRKQVITPPPVKVIAQKYNLPISQPQKIGHAMSKLRDIEPGLIIVAAYSQIIPKNILDIPKFGCLNVHPSLLPKYRGPSPIQAAILNGDKETGVTIILMDEKMDHGPILAQRKLEFPISNFQFPKLHDELANLGAQLLIETIPKWIKEEIKPKPQNESKATYTKILKKEDGKIDWQKSAEEIERQVRALNPWPGTHTIYKGKILKILKAEIIKGRLVIKEVQLEGKKPMSFEDFLRGHPDFINNKAICSRILI